ncbi:MAG: diaminopimelate decarboxylase [Clostridia bacterium]|nr:diaminopimelate decarboxylase [Clostridia bacterium]
MICNNLQIKDNILYFGGRNTVELAEKYGTPVYVMDEQTIRKNCRKYTVAMKKHFGENARAFYASKACCFKKIYNIMQSEGMCVDVVSPGEIYTAKSAGFDMSKVCFHSNSKNDFDINFAMDNGVGCFAVDNFEELEAINSFAGERGFKQKIIFRVTPGIDTHTYEAVNTGKVDSKFGFPIETGAAMEITKKALRMGNIDLAGFHCHVGSQLFDSDVFVRSAKIMLEFIAQVKEETGYEARELDLGGGYGVRYTENDPEIDIEDNIKQVSEYVKALCAELNINEPDISMEPGRSIVADAGITLYKVGNVKRIEGYKNYVAIDGGMGDNPRYALYESEYTVIAADKANESCGFLCDLVGRFCESGDIIQPQIKLPESVARGDIIAVLTTGAYNYSMASNYNRIPKLPVIMINGNDDYVVVKGETFEDLIKNDM